MLVGPIYRFAAGGTPVRLAIVLAAVATSFALIGPAGAGAQVTSQPIGPWDGSNPFRCENQNVGEGTDFPDPDADPFCVEFDKTSQNVTDFGIVDFLVQEPSRVAAAGDKCFYFQRDHWTGSIVQGQDPELWHWDGSYFFDRAKGIGGAEVENFRIGGVPQDGRPYAPPEYHPYFAEGGGGGVIYQLESNPDPSCIAKVDTPEEREQVYGNVPRFKDCISPGGRIRGRKVGKVSLGMTRPDALRRLGPPQSRKHSVSRWCVIGGSKLKIAFRRPASNFPGKGSKRSGGKTTGRAALIKTTNPGYEIRRVGTGSLKRRALKRLQLKRAFTLSRRTRVFTARKSSKRTIAVGISAHRVRWLAVIDPSQLRGRSLKRVLRNAS